MADWLYSPYGERSRRQLALQKSAMIDAELQKHRYTMRNQCNVLFMGRDTQKIMRALKSIMTGFSYEERLSWRVPIFCCIEAQIRKLPDMLRKESSDDVRPSTSSLDIFGPLASHKCSTDWTPEQLKILRSDSLGATIQFVKGKFDGEGFFFLSHIKRITNPGYIPSDEDIMMVPPGFQPAGGHIDVFCLPKRSVPVNVINIDQMRGERKKFIHMFESTPVIIADADLSTFDEDFTGVHPVLKDDIAWFESIVRIRWFVRSSFLLLLKNYNAFSSKLALKPLNEVYPEFSGSSRDPAEAVRYICEKFRQAAKANVEIYPFVCQYDVPKSSHIGDFIFDTAMHSLVRPIVCWGGEISTQKEMHPPVFEELM